MDLFEFMMELLFYVCFELHIVLLNLHLQLHEICSLSVFVLFLFAIVLNALKFMSFVSFGTNVFTDKTFQRSLH